MTDKTEENGQEPLVISNDKVIARLEELRRNQAQGQQVLAQKQQEIAQVQQTLLRIAGAIQALEELANVVEIEKVEIAET